MKVKIENYRKQTNIGYVNVIFAIITKDRPKNYMIRGITHFIITCGIDCFSCTSFIWKCCNEVYLIMEISKKLKII